MDGQDMSPPQVDASRPSIGFPLGTALLLVIIFGLSGVFSCCYHWDKLRLLRRRSFPHVGPTGDDVEASPSKALPPSMDLKQSESQSVPVLMPGDRVPRFIALPSPCEPPRVDQVVVHVQNPTYYKPPLRTIPLPLYI